MKAVSLVRLIEGTHGTFGRLSVNGREWWTVERQATGEHPRIPAGVYPLSPGIHHAGKPDAYPCYWLADVPGRSAIQVHVANWAYQLQGCIAPGLSLERFGPSRILGVTASGDAFKFFMSAMDGDVGEITITEDF